MSNHQSSIDSGGANAAMNRKDFRIRVAEKEDVPLVLEFIKKLARYERLSHEVTATEEILRKNAVGFALYFHNFSTFLGQAGIFIEDLYVDESYRGRGFGRALFLHIAGLARERGCGRVEWSVLDWNGPAIQFYESLGAKALSDWTTYRLAGEALQNLSKAP
jgi:GNAT superfamily N-acetyltransferase